VVPDRRGGTEADDERTEQILTNTRRLSRWAPTSPPGPLTPPAAPGRARGLAWLAALDLRTDHCRLSNYLFYLFLV
jgi:hypothetical protein